jgi:hypothetical protein
VNQAQITEADQRPPVSPEETNTISWTSPSPARKSSQKSTAETGSSALGAGGPSDWEHFQASLEDFKDGEASTMIAQSQSEKPAWNDAYAELPADFSQIAPKRESSQQTSALLMEPALPISADGEFPAREHSVSPEPVGESLRRTGTIDGVIQAWNAYPDVSDTGGPSRNSSVSTVDRSRRDAADSTKPSPRQALHDHSQTSQEQERVSRHNSVVLAAHDQPASVSAIASKENSPPPSTSIKSVEVDPYADLAPEYRASLTRYATMLRKEEAASDEDKYKIFKAFVLKEDRLRTILYNVEPGDSDQSKSPQREVQKNRHEDTTAKVVSNRALSPSPLLPINGSASCEENKMHRPAPNLTIATAAASNEESYVVVERDDASQYSPGGRPLLSRNALRRTASHSPPRSSPKPTSSPSDYAPIVVDEVPHFFGKSTQAVTQDPPLRPGTAPLAMRTESTDGPIKFEPPRPAYTPFRYAEGLPRGSEPLAVVQPAYQAYSALRHQSVDSGRALAQGMAHKSPTRRETFASPTGNSARREHEEAFLGLIREKSRAYRTGNQAKASFDLANDAVPASDQDDDPTREIQTILKTIPTTIPQQRRPSSRMGEANNAMENYPDTFAWIPETVVTWDRKNREIRKKQDEERHARQDESEKNIDALFNEHEIGYSDIGQLEADFKLAEVTRKYDEDAQEVDSFTDKVFKPVSERLKEEISQLNAKYTCAIDVLEFEADSGISYIQGSGDRASRSEAMQTVLILYNKLQIRHVKIVEAHYERERRRKKLELSVLHANRDTAAMKKLEQEFSKAEAQQALHQAREKDSRANKLMDTFDRAAVRGLGDNQQLVDDIVGKLQSAEDLLKKNARNPMDVIRTGSQELFRPIEELLDYMAKDSKAILTISNTADKMLNDADYDVSVAEARVAHASQESMKILEEEKAKEDERIQAEAAARMGSVAKGSEKALSLVRSIMKQLGDDPQHQDRVQKALEAAKLRNASKTPVE